MAATDDGQGIGKVQLAGRRNPEVVTVKRHQIMQIARLGWATILNIPCTPITRESAYPHSHPSYSSLALNQLLIIFYSMLVDFLCL